MHCLSVRVALVAASVIGLSGAGVAVADDGGAHLSIRSARSWEPAQVWFENPAMRCDLHWGRRSEALSPYVVALRLKARGGDAGSNVGPPVLQARGMMRPLTRKDGVDVSYASRRARDGLTLIQRIDRPEHIDPGASRFGAWKDRVTLKLSAEKAALRVRSDMTAPAGRNLRLRCLHINPHAGRPKRVWLRGAAPVERALDEPRKFREPATALVMRTARGWVVAKLNRRATSDVLMQADPKVHLNHTNRYTYCHFEFFPSLQKPTRLRAQMDVSVWPLDTPRARVFEALRASRTQPADGP